ncbi:MAG: DUF4384 domain-containing protein, partial [Deinococcus sp.]
MTTSTSIRLLLAALTLSLAAGSVGAAPRISAQSIIVNPLPVTLGVKVWTDRDLSGQNTPNYSPGERIRIYTSVGQDAYVYLFNVDPNGQVDLILPNRYAGGANFVKANTVKVFPSSQDAFVFTIAAPYGVNKVLALASSTQLNLSDIATFQSGGVAGKFAQVKVEGQKQLAQALSIVVNPVPQNSWITDVAFYNVARGGTSDASPLGVGTVQTGTAYPPYLLAESQQTEWRSTFTAAGGVGDAYAFYAAALQRQGYVQQDSRQGGTRLSGQFQKSGSVVELRVNQSGTRFDVVILKRSETGTTRSAGHFVLECPALSADYSAPDDQGDPRGGPALAALAHGVSDPAGTRPAGVAPAAARVERDQLAAHRARAPADRDAVAAAAAHS